MANVAAASTDAPCCFYWEVTRGPQAGTKFSLCLHQSRPSKDAPLKIGRHKQCWMRLRADLEVSTTHAEVFYEQQTQHVVLRDLKSTNGTRINGTALVPLQDYALEHLDLVVVGKTCLRFHTNQTKSPADNEVDAEVNVTTSSDPVPATPPIEHILDNQENDRQNEQTEGADAMAGRLGSASTQDDFETPDSLQAEEASDSARVTSVPTSCMVCGLQFVGWNVLDQHVHINACLDGRPTMGTTQSYSSTGNNRWPRQGKKRKRNLQDGDDEVAMAVALSKSMVDKEQEIDVDIALVSSEIASIDGQIQKLLRKKETLVKKLAKLEKARLKAAKSVVLAPDETKLFDLDKAFQVLFPPNLKAASFASSRRWMRSAVAIGAVAMYKPRYALPMNMWARAAQVIPSAMTEEQMYYNSVLRPFLPPSVVKQVEEATEAMTSDKSHKGHGMVGCAHNAMDAHAPGTPPSVHRVFPKWRENCEFMGTQSASQLEDALQELQKSMNDFAAEPEEELDGRDDPDSSAPAQRHDELDAYLHVKQVMLRLLHEKRRTAHEVAARVTSIDEANVLSTPEEPPEQQSNHTNADDTSGASTTASNRIDTSIISIQDSSDEGEDSKYSNSDVASDQEQIVGADEVVNPENACLHTGLVGGTAVTLASVGSGPPSIAPSATICADTDADDVRADSTMDDLLMRALQRNEQFYEQVLLLQPIDVDELFTYLTQCPEFTNGQRCTKSYLFPFLDRNGITFKTSGNLASSRRK